MVIANGEQGVRKARPGCGCRPARIKSVGECGPVIEPVKKSRHCGMSESELETVVVGVMSCPVADHGSNVHAEWGIQRIGRREEKGAEMCAQGQPFGIEANRHATIRNPGIGRADKPGDRGANRPAQGSGARIENVECLMLQCGSFRKAAKRDGDDGRAEKCGLDVIARPPFLNIQKAWVVRNTRKSDAAVRQSQSSEVVDCPAPLLQPCLDFRVICVMPGIVIDGIEEMGDGN